MALFVAGVALCNGWILWQARGRTLPLASLPDREVGVVLGTSPLVGKQKNLFFEGRMDAAAKLYLAGKVRHLLLSGDNGTRGYDEPTAMRAALLTRGIPAEALHLDYAGFRTLDTMKRASVVFGVQKAIVITDDFHLPRTLFLADSTGMEAVGYASKPLSLRDSGKTRIRETVSRVAAILDIYVLHTEPRFLGPKEDLRLASDER